MTLGDLRSPESGSARRPATTGSQTGYNDKNETRMHDVDFLPAEYRQTRERRRMHPWRAFVVTAFVALVATASLAQLHHRRQIEAELATLEPQRAMIDRQNAELAEMQAELAVQRARAELITYLRHPWPRTQLLEGLLAPLPEMVTFERLEIYGEETASSSPEPRSPVGRGKAAEAEHAKLSPARRDLEQLRGEYDARRTLVAVTGVTGDSAALHRYLGNLGKKYLFSKVELRSIEALPGAAEERLRFQAVLTVRPGYGQPGGPNAPPADDRVAVARTP